MYLASQDTCYSYEVMKQICLLVKYVRDPTTNTYSYVYTGGCYKDNKPIWYDQASVGEKITFKDVQFEVRRDYRTGEEIEDMEDEDTEEYEMQNDEDEDGNPIEKKETPQQKIKKQREQLIQ